MYFIFLLGILLFNQMAISEECDHTNFSKPLKVLHLTFHQGCSKELEAIAKELSLEIITWFIPNLPPKSLDGVTQTSAIYNIGHQRAQNIWELHHEYFQTFDVIVTSDTAPLSRIFLQNNWKKPLIIWICNRFDYSDQASLDCDFPDEEYYQLFNEARRQPNVTIIAYTEFEHYYAKNKGVDTGTLTITPCASTIVDYKNSAIPANVDKKNTFFLPPYHNEKEFMDLSAFCNSLDIKTYCGNYNGPMDLNDFKGIIHLPYSWSNLAFFENTRLGIPYFIPSSTFFEELALQGNYFHPQLTYLVNFKLYELSEWYSPEHSQIITYFDSWEDLVEKINRTDFEALRECIIAYGKLHKAKMIQRWRDVFEAL